MRLILLIPLDFNTRFYVQITNDSGALHKLKKRKLNGKERTIAKGDRIGESDQGNLKIKK